MSIRWPFIKNSGMNMDSNILEKMISKTGIQELDISNINNFIFCDYSESHVNIVPGNKNKIFENLKNNN